jgi:hypothetical protein
MKTRLLLLGAAMGVLGTGCGVQQLPAAAAPAKVIPADLDVPVEPPAAGTGRVILETNGEPAKVVEITGTATATNGRYSATIVGVRPLCTTPCIVDLPYGSHPLVLHSISDATHQSETELEVGARAKVFRHALGERKDGGALRTVGSSLLTLGVLAAATGAVLWAAGASNTNGSDLAGKGQLLTALGAGGIALSIPLLIVGRPTERAGSTTQWNLPGSAAPPPLGPQAPAGAALDRL